MRDVPFISPAERTIYAAYDRDRRLRLSRVIAPIFAAILSLVLIMALLAPAELSGTRHYFGVVLACDALFALGAVAAWRGRVNLATISIILAALLLMVLSVLVNQPFILSDLFTVPVVVIIGLAALIGLPWMIFGTTICTSAFVLVLAEAPSLARDMADHNNVNSLAAFLIEQWILAIALYAAARGYRRVLREISDVRVQYERARQLEELKDQFITNVNHELRNPVMLMQGYIELLRIKQHELPDETRVSLVERASKAGDHLAELLKSILDVRRLDQGARDFVPEAVPLREAVEAAATLVDPRDGQMIERELRVNVPPNLAVWGERVRVQQILTNLFSNAVKYSPPGTPVEVSTRVLTPRPGSLGRSTRQVVEISVRDYGLGIPPDQIPLLFHRFVRLPRDLASTTSGNGLGLYICREIAEAMGGRIRVESSGVEGEGSTFYLTLPRPPGMMTHPPVRLGSAPPVRARAPASSGAGAGKEA
jgi:signal transduction histidine kinase